MITLFKIITEAGTNDARILAGGISEALVTTQTGLIIAIPILLIHGYLAERMDEINSSLYAESLTLLNRMWPDSVNTKI
jgi:biopolymer transport protein ExbB